MRATIPSGLAFSWQSQASQYPHKGTPGIAYFRGDLPDTDKIVDCLLYRNISGHLIGILNYYSWDSEWEDAGNCNLWVRPDCQRQGIGTHLLREAQKRWQVEIEQQRYTPEGLALVEALLANP